MQFHIRQAVSDSGHWLWQAFVSLLDRWIWQPLLSFLKHRVWEPTLYFLEHWIWLPLLAFLDSWLWQPILGILAALVATGRAIFTDLWTSRLILIVVAEAIGAMGGSDWNHDLQAVNSALLDKPWLPVGSETWAAAGITEDDVLNGVVLGPDNYVYRPPPPSKNLTIEMQVSVSECQTWREVLDVVDRNGDLFDFRNTSTAIHRVARYGAEEHQQVKAHPVFPRLLALLRAKIKFLSARAASDAAWGLAKLGCGRSEEGEELFRRISLRTRELREDLDPQGLALIAWAFGTAGYQDDDVMLVLADQSRRKMHEFGPQNIANLVWATATLGFKHDPLHREIEAASLRGLDGFSTQELAMVNWALTKLAFPVSNAWRTNFRRRVMQLKEYAPSELSMLAWALGTRGEYDPDLMAYIARRSMESMRGFTGQNIATIIWALGTVSYKDDPCIDEFLRMALGAIIARANEFQPLNLALISWGLAKLAYRAEVAFEAMCAAATNQIEKFVPQNLVQILWACATSGFRDDTFLQAAGRVAKRSLHDFSSQHLSNFIWACARLGYKEDPELLRSFSAASIRKMGEGSPQHLSNVAWAVGQLGPEYFPNCLESIVEVTSRRLTDFDPPSLMMLSDSLYEAGYGANRREPLLDVLRGKVMGFGNELLHIFTEALPVHPSSGSTAGASPGPPRGVDEYRRRLRSTGLVTFGYEHTNSLFGKLELAAGHCAWDHAQATSLPGWTTNARRTTTARRYAITVGPEHLEDQGTVFTSAFASAAEDAACELVVTWLGQGKADSPDVGRAGRSGDAECRAIVDTHQLLKRAMTASPHGADLRGWVAFHTSGVPCLSCVGVAAQFKRLYPGLSFSFTFASREHGFGGEGGQEISQASSASRLAPKSAPPAYSSPPLDHVGTRSAHHSDGKSQWPGAAGGYAESFAQSPHAGGGCCGCGIGGSGCATGGGSA